ncbi:hypothetical protein [Archaeoglobus veneficus]|uniref:ABC-2 type transporter n=1 Tax=Archaeoglobus veneficus (strain DSM 11195 / SNP6) TaxID=693661 RepID=F2KSP4_ARCVS|nr:hypothetical protein [Archaeoglobus veneficus]AEA48114.1 hypothetical protein Arcve_2125 [Archaeoglobus veneficus SNP6]
MMRLFNISRLELKKSRKKYSRGLVAVIVILSIFAGLSAYFSAGEGVKSDSKLYVVASPYRIEERHFVWYPMSAGKAIPLVRSGEVDVALGQLFLIVGKSDKALAAADELKALIERLFEEELYRRYGSDAFPVFVSVEYVKRDVTYQIGFKGEEKSRREETSSAPGQAPTLPPTPAPAPEELPKPFEETEGLGRVIGGEEKYVTPKNFSPPNLLGKLVYAFLFILPSYFAVQVFSSSLIEDRTAKRLDVLLATPTSPLTVLMGKLLPYLATAVLSVLAASLILGKSPVALAYVLPVILFFAALQAFFAINARSYKEMTFFVISTSLLVTAYIFIPAVFAGTIPVSKVSPITLMLADFEGEEIGLRDYVFATLQFYAMAAVLMVLAAKSMSPEIAHSSKSIPEKVVLALTGLMKREWHAAIASIAAIPFVFMVEFLLLSVLFVLPMEYSIPLFVGVVAVVEEAFKGSVLLAAIRKGLSPYPSALACGLGFFAGEKLIVLLNVATQYNALLLAQFFVLPLILHVSTMLLFALFRSHPPLAFTLAATLHFFYNLAVVMTLA